MLDRWQEFWGRLSGRAQRTAIAVTAVAAVVVFVGYWIYSSHDAQRYCDDIFSAPGPLPEWVTNGHAFSTYGECVDWYRKGEVESARP